MARTIRIKLYKFSELTQDAQQTAINDWREGNAQNGYPWQEEYQQTLQAFINLFPVKPNRRGAGIVFHSCHPYGADKYRCLSGQRLATYIWNHYQKELFSGKYYSLHTVRASDYKSRRSNCQIEHSCELTGYYMDEDILQPVYEFINKPRNIDFEDLMNECFSAWESACEKNLEWQNSDEYIREEIIVNEGEYTRDGKRY
jgi:hypothetical protein